MDIAAWLRELGLERYEEAFRDNEIDGAILPRLTSDDLREIGVTAIGHRRKLLEATAALAGDEAPRGSQSEPDAPAPTVQPSDPARSTVGSPRSEAERRQLSVMFVDLVGSTALSARLDPEDMSAVMRAYQAAVAREIARFEGHVAKYMGDGVLAYFGWPRAHEDDAERAVRAGLQLVQAVGQLEIGDGGPLAARVGVATGQVVVGDLICKGAAEEEAVVGETPNPAARLQALAEPGSVVIDPRCQKLVGGLFEYADLGTQDLKGFAEPVSDLARARRESSREPFRGHAWSTAHGADRPRARDRFASGPMGARQRR